MCCLQKTKLGKLWNNFALFYWTHQFMALSVVVLLLLHPYAGKIAPQQRHRNSTWVSQYARYCLVHVFCMLTCHRAKQEHALTVYQVWKLSRQPLNAIRVCCAIACPCTAIKHMAQGICTRLTSRCLPADLHHLGCGRLPAGSHCALHHVSYYQQVHAIIPPWTQDVGCI